MGNGICCVKSGSSKRGRISNEQGKRRKEYRYSIVKKNNHSGTSTVSDLPAPLVKSLSGSHKSLDDGHKKLASPWPDLNDLSGSKLGSSSHCYQVLAKQLSMKNSTKQEGLYTVSGDIANNGAKLKGVPLPNQSKQQASTIRKSVNGGEIGTPVRRATVNTVPVIGSGTPSSLQILAAVMSHQQKLFQYAHQMNFMLAERMAAHNKAINHTLNNYLNGMNRSKRKIHTPINQRRLSGMSKSQ